MIGNNVEAAECNNVEATECNNVEATEGNNVEDIDCKVMDIYKWRTPATDYPKKECGSARIIHGFYNWGYFHNYGVNGYKFFRVIRQIPVTSLEIKMQSKHPGGDKDTWETWMVDDPPHYWSMQNYARNSTGRVLVAGLGLGLVVHELLDNIDVDSITVVEINKDVIDLISPLLPKPENVGFKIINGDFYTFINETKEKFDRIIIDLWTTGSAEETMKVLNEEVEPLAYYIEKLFPDSSVVFHGFGLEW